MHHMIIKKFPLLSNKLKTILDATTRDIHNTVAADTHNEGQEKNNAESHNPAPPTIVIPKIAKRKRHTEEDESADIPESKRNQKEVVMKKEERDGVKLSKNGEDQQLPSQLQLISPSSFAQNESMDVDETESIDNNRASSQIAATKHSPLKKLKRNKIIDDDEDEEEEFDDDYKPHYAVAPVSTSSLKKENVEVEDEEGEVHEEDEFLDDGSKAEVKDTSMEVEEEQGNVEGQHDHEEGQEEEDAYEDNEQKDADESDEDQDEATVDFDGAEEENEGAEDDSDYSEGGGEDEDEEGEEVEDNEEQRAKDAAELMNETTFAKNEEPHDDADEELNEDEAGNISTASVEDLVESTNDEVRQILQSSGKGVYCIDSNDAKIKIPKLFAYSEMENTINECMDYDPPSKSNCPWQLLANIHDYLESIDSEKHFTSPVSLQMALSSLFFPYFFSIFQMKVQMDYPKFIPSPIHLNSIRLKIERGNYADAFATYLTDIQQMITNCIKLYCILKRSESEEDQAALKSIPFKVSISDWSTIK
jgi:hypothetical protein